MWGLISIFIVLVGITIWSLVDKEPPTLVKPPRKKISVTKKYRMLVTKTVTHVAKELTRALLDR